MNRCFLIVVCGLVLVMGCVSPRQTKVTLISFDGIVPGSLRTDGRSYKLRVETPNTVAIHTNALGETAEGFKLVRYYESDQYAPPDPEELKRESGDLCYLIIRKLVSTNHTSVLTVEWKGKRIGLHEGQTYICVGK